MASVKVSSIPGTSLFTNSDKKAYSLSNGYDATEAGRKTAVTEVQPASEDNPNLKQGNKIEFQLEEHPVDQVRDLKVGIIGAGLAGISAGILLPVKLPGLDLRIYEKNADVVFHSK
jgi:hypothetical protein